MNDLKHTEFTLFLLVISRFLVLSCDVLTYRKREINWFLTSLQARNGFPHSLTDMDLGFHLSVKDQIAFHALSKLPATHGIYFKDKPAPRYLSSNLRRGRTQKQYNQSLTKVHLQSPDICFRNLQTSYPLVPQQLSVLQGRTCLIRSNASILISNKFSSQS